MKSLRLLHIDFLVQIAICESRGDVHRTKFKVFYSSHGHNDAKCGRTEGGRKAFIVVKSRMLGVALCNNSGLQVLNGEPSALCLTRKTQPDPMAFWHAGKSTISKVPVSERCTQVWHIVQFAHTATLFCCGLLHIIWCLGMLHMSGNLINSGEMYSPPLLS